MTRFLKILNLVILLCAWALPASAAPAPGKQSLTYEVYAGGIHVLQAQVVIEMKGQGKNSSRYDILMSAHPIGLLATLVPWQGTFESAGWVAPGGEHFIPEIHRSDDIWRGATELKEYHYKRDTGFTELVITEKGKTKKQKPQPELTQGTTDALTATLDVLQAVANGKECAGASDVYDGKRRFTEKFNPLTSEELSATPYNIYSGPAAVCSVEVIPGKGEWSKKPRGWMSIQEQGRKAGALPTMWVAKLNDTGPAVPVRIQLKTSYGTLLLHLAQYKNGDKILSAGKSK